MKKGFTLAETLITLAIIGVVAAFTIPTLNNFTKEVEHKSKAKKVYQVLTNAMAMNHLKGYFRKYNPSNDSTENIRNWFDEYLRPHLSVMKVCNDTTGCWHNGNTYGLNGSLIYCSRVGKIGDNVITVLLNDGTALNIDSYGKGSINSYFGVDIPTAAGFVIFFDVNGEKKPNKLGKDIFAVVSKDDTFVPAYSNKSEADVLANCSKQGTGYSCLQKILTKE